MISGELKVNRESLYESVCRKNVCMGEVGCRHSLSLPPFFPSPQGTLSMAKWQRGSDDEIKGI